MNGSEHPAPAASEEAAAIKEGWTPGTVPDAAAALAQHPELLADKSIVLDLAYEEYCLRAEAGEALDAEAFCARFPAYRSSLHRLITAHQFLALNSGLLGSAPPARWPEPGERWNEFTLLRELGRGAFARVYLATEASTGDRPVAIKLSFDGGTEAHTLGRLNHPNIVPVLSARFDVASGLTGVCMPFLGAATLTDVLDRAYPKDASAPPRRASVIVESIRASIRTGDPPLIELQPDRLLVCGRYDEGVARLGLELAEALVFLHSRQVCHLDLKPSNVLLNNAGRPMLLDFNLSIDARNGTSRAGGTLPYIAPEQIRALLAESSSAPTPDAKADLFSLGVILYELLTGAPPFGPLPQLPLRQLGAVLLERQRAGCRSVRALAPATGSGLAAVVDRCLYFETADRPASATAVAAGLRRFLANRRRARFAVRAGAVVVAIALTVATAALALRPPAAIARGRSAFGAGNYAEAARWFDQAVAENPGNRQARWNQALTRLKMSELAAPDDMRKQVQLALEAFYSLGDHHRPEVHAVIAYCLSRLTLHREAVYEYGKAEAAGDRSTELYNNRAYSHLCLSEWQAAAADLTKALERDSTLPAAYHNRTFLAYQQWLKSHDRQLAMAGQQDADRAIALGEYSLNLYFVAAVLTVGAGQPNASDRALGYLESAIDQGKPPAAIVSDPFLAQALADRPAFRELGKRHPPAVVPAGSSRLVHPILTLDD